MNSRTFKGIFQTFKEKPFFHVLLRYSRGQVKVGRGFPALPFGALHSEIGEFERETCLACGASYIDTPNAARRRHLGSPICQILFHDDRDLWWGCLLTSRSWLPSRLFACLSLQDIRPGKTLEHASKLTNLPHLPEHELSPLRETEVSFCSSHQASRVRGG